VPASRRLWHHRLRRRTRLGYRAGGYAPPAAEFPVCWFSDPISLRLLRPYNHAEVTQVDGVTARADNTTSIATYGAVYPFTATLSTAVDADPENLASWTVTYNGNPRTTAPSLSVQLLYRTDAEKLQILQVGRGQRIRLTGLPIQWPESAKTLVVAGIRHQASIAGHTVTWTTTPVVGSVDGIPGPWFRWGSSSRGGTDIRVF